MQSELLCLCEFRGWLPLAHPAYCVDLVFSIKLKIRKVQVSRYVPPDDRTAILSQACDLFRKTAAATSWKGRYGVLIHGQTKAEFIRKLKCPDVRSYRQLY